MRNRTLAACTALVAVLGACASPPNGGVGAGATAARGRTAEVTTAGDVALPAVRPAAEPSPSPGPTAATPSEPPLPTEVVTRDAELVVAGDAPLDDAALEAVAALPGVEHVAAVAPAPLRVEGPAGSSVDVDALVVDHESFRPLTPDVTAQAPAVWERLRDGEVVLGHDVAHEVDAELGGALTLAAGDELQVARAGAFAANGTPPHADVLVPHEVAELLGLPTATGLLVSAAEGTDLGDLEAALTQVLGPVTVEQRVPPTPQVAASAPVGRIEPFDYTDLGDGTIAIDPAWVAEWIVPVEIPGIATTRCHRVIVPQLLAALAEIEALGLYDHFKPEQFGGCWVARRIDWSPDRPLSNHAWGTAIDFNTHDNWLGEQPMMDRRIVAVFEKWGFAWGGHWSRPDGMHFELERVVVPG